MFKDMTETQAERDRVWADGLATIGRALETFTKARREGRSAATYNATERAMAEEVQALSRRLAKFNLDGVPVLAASLGITPDPVKDEASFYKGALGATVALVGMLTAEGVTVTIEREVAPKKRSAFEDALRSALAKEVMESLGIGAPPLPPPLCAAVGSVLRVFKATKDAADFFLEKKDDPEGIDRKARFEVKAGDVIEDVYDPLDKEPQRSVLVNKRTGQRAPFAYGFQLGDAQANGYEVTATPWKCTCSTEKKLAGLFSALGRR